MLKKWLELGLEAKNYVTQKLISQSVSHEERLELTEKISLLFQSKNLLTYPDVERRVNEGELFIRSWYYRLDTGELEYFNTESGEFEPMSSSSEF